jgi:hypothetical protein
MDIKSDETTFRVENNEKNEGMSRIIETKTIETSFESNEFLKSIEFHEQRINDIEEELAKRREFVSKLKTMRGEAERIEKIRTESIAKELEGLKS